MDTRWTASFGPFSIAYPRNHRAHAWSRYGELIDAVSPSGTYNNLPDALDRKMFPLLAGNHGLAHAVRIAYRWSKHIHVVSATNWRASSGVVNARSGPGPPA
jgi:hypothetical protein